MIDRTALRQAYRPDENEIVRQRLTEARLGASQQAEATAMARALVKAVRGHKAAGLDAFLQAIDRSVILETVRTGSSGIGRGERILRL